MEQKNNIMGTVSLGCGIGLIVCYFLGMCLGFIPFLGIFALIFFPIDWVLAIAGLVTGVVGYNASKTMEGVGGPQSLAGALICGGWILFQIVIIGLVFVFFGGAVFLSLIGAALGNH